MKTLTKMTISITMTIIAFFAVGNVDIVAQDLVVTNNTDCIVEVQGAHGSLCIAGCSASTFINANDTETISACAISGDWLFINFTAFGSATDSKSYNTQLNPICGFDLLNATCNNVQITTNWTSATKVELNN